VVAVSLDSLDNKLECLSIANLSSLVLYMRVRPYPIPLETSIQGRHLALDYIDTWFLPYHSLYFNTG
jgi:hypothetical protein